tara:strand:+ start:47 stop:331 length:285 start_codon:yes stop_codon:yes gene_type:complete
MGRIIRNHSTHIEGLIDILFAISKHKEVMSVTPGSLKRVKGNSEKMTLRIKKLVKGGFKLLARKGRMAQEVYILTGLLDNELNELIVKTIKKKG